MSTPPEYEIVIVGGGPAGLTAAMYATRLSYDIAVINRDGGRASRMWNTYTDIGITEDTSGNEFLESRQHNSKGTGEPVHSSRQNNHSG